MLLGPALPQLALENLALRHPIENRVSFPVKQTVLR